MGETAAIDLCAAGIAFDDPLLRGAVGENVLADIEVGAVVGDIFCGIYAAACRFHLREEDKANDQRNDQVRKFMRFFQFCIQRPTPPLNILVPSD